MSSSNNCDTCVANLGLWITKPSSVLSNAERGSKLNDPTNKRLPSTANVFACKLDPAIPIGLRILRLIRRGRGASSWMVFLSSNNSTDRKSTRLNSSHVAISYAVFCLKKKKKQTSPVRMIYPNNHQEAL